MSLHGKNILGAALSAEGQATFQSLNPATGEHLEGVFHNATRAEVDRALHLANEAFRCRRDDSQQTAALLDRAADEIEGIGDELIDRCVAETALPATRIKLERGRTTGQLRMFAALVREGSWVDARIDRPQPKRKPIPRPDLRRMLRPIGPVVVFPASNFPLAFSTAGGDTASAFAAGCPVIVKARPSHAGTCELIGGAIQRAVAAVGLPEGWFSQLHGLGREVGTYLVEHPVVKAVGFTGSLTGGKALMAAAAARPEPIPVYAEMGSINPVFLLPDVMSQRAEQIAEAYYQSLTLGVGQFCTNPGLVVGITGEALERFSAAVAKRVQATAPGSMLLPAIRDEYESGVTRMSGVPGVSCLAQAGLPSPACESGVGGEGCGNFESVEIDRAKTQCRAALYSVKADVFLNLHDLRQEVFGPAALIVQCGDRQEMLAVAESFDGQLTATVHGTEDELAAAAELLAVLERKAGRLLVNGFPTGVEVSAAMNHGGPFPAASDAHYTSVGTAAIYRFARPVCYQNLPQRLLPAELQDVNASGIWRLLDDVWTKADVG